MSSSSEGEEIVVPLKRVKRRHPHPEINMGHTKKINLYSHKILPKLDALAKSPIKLTAGDEDEGNDSVPFSITPAPPNEVSKVASPEKQQTISETSSPVKVIPLTPPPPFNPERKGRRGSRKAKKLLNEVSSVLSQVSSLDASNDSVVVEEFIDHVKEIMVKVRVRGRLQKFPTLEDGTFSDIFEKLAKKEKVEKSRLLVTLGDRRIFPSDTPTGIQLSIADILECVVVHRRLAPHVKDTIKIQMQGPFERRKVTFTMGKDEPLEAVMQEYADKNKTDVKTLQFLFDGENLSPESTPKSLDLDNGDCLDVMHRA